MSFSLSRGGEASVVVGLCFLGSLPFAVFAICSSLRRHWLKKCQLIGARTRRLLSISNDIGTYSAERRSLCCVWYRGRLLRRSIQQGGAAVVLALLCIRHELTMLTTDGDFSLAATYCALKVWRPL